MAQKKNVKKKKTPKQPISGKGSVASRKVDWNTGKTAHRLRWLAMIPLALLAVFFRFFMAGYSFTVLVCCCVMAVLLVYNVLDLLRGKYPKQTKVVRRLFTILLCIGLLVAAVTEFFIIRASFGEPGEQVEYLVVLGAKVRPDGPSVSLMDRIKAAYSYLTEHPEVIAVVSGGKGDDEHISEALCMYQELTAMGIDPDRIWMEDRATSTWENLRFTLDLIEEKTGERPDHLGIISSEYHLFRASLFADRIGIGSTLIPARTSRFSQLVNHLMREVAGVWHFILLGGKYHD